MESKTRQAKSSVAVVTGASGMIGPILTRAVASAGYRVRTLARNPFSDPTLRVERMFQGDVCDPDVLKELMKGADIVFHLAAKLHVTHPDEHEQEQHQRVNVVGTQQVVDASLQARVERFVYFSTINVYGPSFGASPFTEETPPNPQSRYAESKLAGESIVRDATDSRTGHPVGVVLRVAAVYGQRLAGNYRRLVQALNTGWFPRIGPGTNRRTLVHERDLVAAALLAARHPSAAGRTYNVTDGSVHSFNEILSAICRALGKREPRYGLSPAIVRAVAAGVEDLSRLAGMRAPIGRQTVDKLLEDIAVDGSRIQRELGHTPMVDLQSGWEMALQDR